MALAHDSAPIQAWERGKKVNWHPGCECGIEGLGVWRYRNILTAHGD